MISWHIVLFLAQIPKQLSTLWPANQKIINAYPIYMHTFAVHFPSTSHFQINNLWMKLRSQSWRPISLAVHAYYWWKCHELAVKHVHEMCMPMLGWYSFSARLQSEWAVAAGKPIGWKETGRERNRVGEGVAGHKGVGAGSDFHHRTLSLAVG